MKKVVLLLACVIAVVMATSCQSYRHTMREPNVKVTLNSNDLELSSQVSAEATVTRIVGLDWARLFGKTETGVTPVLGAILPTGANYALYKLMQENPGYDVVIYPQVEAHRHAPILGTDLYSKTTYKVTARLGKLKK